MEVKIRNVDPQYIKEIDRKAKEIAERTQSKFSRNDYLKLLLRQDSEIDLINYKKSEFDLLLDKLLLNNLENTEAIKDLTEVYQNLFNFLISTIDISEGE